MFSCIENLLTRRKLCRQDKFILEATKSKKRQRPRFLRAFIMERVRRVELPTLCLASIRSSQLSYTRTDKIST